MWRKREKLDFLSKGRIVWQSLTPDVKHSWIVPENADEYNEFVALSEIFSLYTVGVKTNRDDVVYAWDRDRLAVRIRSFIADYNAEVYRHKSDPSADWPDRLRWSRDLKQDAHNAVGSPSLRIISFRLRSIDLTRKSGCFSTVF